MFPSQTLATEGTAEKCLDKRVQSKRVPKHKLGKGINRWSKYKCMPTIAAQIAV